MSEATKAPVAHTVRNFEILKYLLNTISGRDKLAKLLKCVLDLIRKLTTSFNSVIRLKGTTLQTVSNVARELTIFRFLLRFGLLPFKVSKFATSLGSLQTATEKVSRKSIVDEPLTQDAIDVYKAVFDELDLLYRLGVYKDSATYAVVTRHTQLATEYDTLLNLRKNWRKLQQQQHGSSDVCTVKMELVRLSMDLATNSMDLFAVESMPMFKDYRAYVSLLYTTMAIVSSALSVVKLWTTTKQDLAAAQ